jgi:hypothetical protein
MKKKGIEEKQHLKNKTPGLVRVRSGHGSTGFCRAIAPASFLLNPDRSSHRVDRVSGRPTGPGPV